MMFLNDSFGFRTGRYESYDRRPTSNSLLGIVLLLGFLSGVPGNRDLITLEDALRENFAVFTIAMSTRLVVTLGLPQRCRDLKLFCSIILFTVATTVE